MSETKTFRQMLEDYGELAYHYTGKEYVEKCQELLDKEWVALKKSNLTQK